MAEYQGGWIFKVDGALYGPVPTEALVAKLREGELGPETLVAKESGGFSPLGTLEPFVVIAASAAAERRAREEAEKGARRRRVRYAVVAACLLPLLGAGVVAFRWERDPSLGRKELAQITIEVLPMVVRAVPDPKEVGWEEVGDEALGRAAPGTPQKKPTPAATARASGTVAAVAEGAVASAAAFGAAATRGAAAEDVQVETRFDLAAIERVVDARRGQLLPCLRQQAERDPRFRGEVPLAFVVGQGGRVSRLWVDKPGYRDGELHRCLLGQLQGWQFPSFDGQSPAISLSFRIGG